MPANIIRLNSANLHLPTLLVLDASILLEGVLPNNQNVRHQQGIDFLHLLQTEAKNGNTMGLLPLLAYEECLFKIIQIELKDNPINDKRWHDKYKEFPDLIAQTKNTVDRFNSFLKAFPISIIEPEDLTVGDSPSSVKFSEKINHYIYSCNILPKDATILSSADRLGITHIATMDKDFERVDGFTVYLPL